MKANTPTIKFTDIPIEVFQQAAKQIDDYSTALFLEGTFIGTGTFICWKDKFGLLTAEHVTNNPDSSRLTCRFNASSDQMLQLVVATHPHHLGFELRYLQNITLGQRMSDEFGPDISVIILPECPQLGLIKSMKSFWRLDERHAEKLDEALNDGNFAMLAGCPAERQSKIETHRGKALRVPGIAVPTMPSKYFNKDGFDYVETTLGLGKAIGSDVVLSYEGVSGGSLWRIKIGKFLSENNIVTKPYLMGVNFWQGNEIDGVRILRSHGPTTIYELLLPKLLSA